MPSGPVLGVQFAPVSADDPALKIATLSFCLVTFATASAADDTGTSMIMSTPSRSYQEAARLAATSGLVEKSAEIISTSKPPPILWKSSMASFVIATDPCPLSSAYGPAKSVITPILIGCAARARGAISVAAVAAIKVLRLSLIDFFPAFVLILEGAASSDAKQLVHHRRVVLGLQRIAREQTVPQDHAGHRQPMRGADASGLMGKADRRRNVVEG